MLPKQLKDSQRHQRQPKQVELFLQSPWWSRKDKARATYCNGLYCHNNSEFGFLSSIAGYTDLTRPMLHSMTGVKDTNRTKVTSMLKLMNTSTEVMSSSSTNAWNTTRVLPHINVWLISGCCVSFMVIRFIFGLFITLHQYERDLLCYSYC